jgi:hypothetical protein
MHLKRSKTDLQTRYNTLCIQKDRHLAAESKDGLGIGAFSSNGSNTLSRA